MKIWLVLGLIMAGMTVTASAQSFSTSTTQRKTETVQRRTPPVSHTEVTGVIPRALRGGNPLQMLNPRAPARYGTAEQSVLYDPRYPGKWKGIKLFTILF